MPTTEPTTPHDPLSSEYAAVLAALSELPRMPEDADFRKEYGPLWQKCNALKKRLDRIERDGEYVAELEELAELVGEHVAAEVTRRYGRSIYGNTCAVTLWAMDECFMGDTFREAVEKCVAHWRAQNGIEEVTAG
jgi:tetrahydromethanopterin S-methyltransferase subunit G